MNKSEITKAYLFNDLMNKDWSNQITAFSNDDDWKPKKEQLYFMVWNEIENTQYQLAVLPSPKHVLNFINENHKNINGKLYTTCGMSL